MGEYLDKTYFSISNLNNFETFRRSVEDILLLNTSLKHLGLTNKKHAPKICWVRFRRLLLNNLLDYSSIDRQYDVAAVVGLPSSSRAVMSANILSVFKIPNLSLFATSDDLSDKTRYEYFMRLLPADKFQVTINVHCYITKKIM